MRNIRLTLAYDGTDYVGWQVQPNGRSIQATVESAIHKLTGEPAKLLAAGRTDSGVHALGQVANFETGTSIPCDRIRFGLQKHLPGDIIVREAEDVHSAFHATYGAKQKHYRYVIYNSRVKNPFVRKYAYQFSGKLDVKSMHQAIQVLLGTHDFRCFESHFPNKATSVRTVNEVSVDRYSLCPTWFYSVSDTPVPCPNGKFICLDIVADGFLYNMVRTIVGTLMKVGRHVWTADDVRRIINSQERAQAGETAPPHGLYLVSVDYSYKEHE